MARQVELWLATETPIMFASSPNSNWSVPTLQKEKRVGIEGVEMQKLCPHRGLTVDDLEFHFGVHEDKG